MKYGIVILWMLAAPDILYGMNQTLNNKEKSLLFFDKLYDAIEKHEMQELVNLSKDTEFTTVFNIKKLLVTAALPYIDNQTLTYAKCHDRGIEQKTNSKWSTENLNKALAQQQNSKMINLLLPLADQHTKNSPLWTIFKMHTPKSMVSESVYKRYPQFFNIFIRKKRRELIGLLLSNGADPNARNNKGNSFCHLMAAGNSDDKLIILVHEHNGDFMLQNNKLDTPFHIEIAKQKQKICSLLIPFFKECDQAKYRKIVVTKNKLKMTVYEMVCFMHKNTIKNQNLLDRIEFNKRCTFYTNLKMLF